MKKKIHSLAIIDKSSSMEKFRSRTIEGINTNISALKKEVDQDTEIINTQLQFSSVSNYFSNNTDQHERDFVFNRIGQSVSELVDMTEEDYIPSGVTPLLDAIGYGIEKVKDFHKDELGSDDLKIIVTIFTDGEENSSKKWDKAQIKK